MSILPYEFFIARRYLKSRSKTGFINLITYISIIGVSIGVAALIIVLSVMNGFEAEVRNRILGFDSHIRLRTYHDLGIDDYKFILSEIQGMDHVTGMSPYIMGEGMLKHGEKTSGVILRGAEQTTIGDVSDLPNNIIYGKLDLGVVNQPDDGKGLPGIVLGRWLAETLMLNIGDSVILISPMGVRSIFQVPPMLQCVVTGCFETGMYEYDNAYAYISIETAQKLFKFPPDKVSGIEIKLDNLYKAASVVDEIDKRLGFPYFALTWFEMRQNLFSWMQMEKWAMFIVLCLIIIVAAFNIVSTLIMVVMEKTREIGILKSMGATPKSITRIFIYEGIVVGVTGTFIGCVIGFGLCWLQLTYGFFSLPGEVYFISQLPVLMKISDFIFIASASVLLCLLAAMYPAKKAALLDPVVAIRYE